MPTLLLRFPGRRYHATPWGYHVNEGLIEWPPSPWRLLRALISVGYTSAAWNGSGPPPVARSLIEKLASTLPHYRLPSVPGAHSRHYMPVAALEKDRERTTLVFDTWAQMDDATLAVAWNVTLGGDERSMLATLAARLNYLGRSESWVAATVAEDDLVSHEGSPCIPDEAAVHRRGLEQVRLLAPQSSAVYAEWRQTAVADALAALESGGMKVSVKARRKAQAPYPEDILACLQTETAWLRLHGWSQPPGSRRVFYLRRVDALEAGAPRPAGRVLRSVPVEAILLSITSAVGNNRLLPPLSRTLPQSELLHRALIRMVSGPEGRHSSVLTGCDENGASLRGAHTHGHLLPLDLDGDAHIDHVLIWAPTGLDADAQKAVRAVRQTFTKGGDAPLRLALAGAGTLDSFRLIAGDAGARLRAVLGPAAGSTSWVSTTPFVPPRFPKKKGRNTIEGQILAELASRGLPEPMTVDLINWRNDVVRRHRHFVRVRRSGPPPPVDAGFTVELRFQAPVAGPICLGYASHFGLGMFQVSPTPTR